MGGRVTCVCVRAQVLSWHVFLQHNLIEEFNLVHPLPAYQLLPTRLRVS